MIIIHITNKYHCTVFPLSWCSVFARTWVFGKKLYKGVYIIRNSATWTNVQFPCIFLSRTSTTLRAGFPVSMKRTEHKMIRSQLNDRKVDDKMIEINLLSNIWWNRKYHDTITQGNSTKMAINQANTWPKEHKTMILCTLWFWKEH